jgi:hypothetical protein
MSRLRALPFLCALAGSQLLASVSVQLTAPASTIEVGQSLQLTASAKDSATSKTKFSYQFTVRPHNQADWIVMQDYYWYNTFWFTPSDHEGVYDIGVTAWSETTHNSAPTYFTVTVEPRVTSSTPLISSTNNELVALYSAPACSAPLQMRVDFTAPSATGPVNTSWKPCNGLTMNFYLGGMLPSTTYTVQHFLSNGTAGPQLTWTTGSVPSNVAIPGHGILHGPTPPTSTTYPFLLHATDGAAPYATDLSGHVVWYRTPNISIDSGYMVRLLPGGIFLTIDDDPINSKQICGDVAATNCGDHQFLREYDLAGNIVRSTSWAVVNDEVNDLRATQGGSQVRLNFFSHDAIRLPNGYTAVLATDEQVKAVNGVTQDVFADMVIVLDTNLQVTWAWDAFDYLDINRMTIGSTCVKGGPGCPSEFFNKQPNGQPYTQALDWTHANSLFYDPADGNLVASFRHQSWAVKINYSNGTGNGNIIWKLGFDGSFALAPGFPVTDWFSGQHDVEFHSNGILTLFDNNNASSVTQQPGGDARGQAWSLNTNTMVATPIENVGLGVVSQAVGTAQLLSNGNYSWQAGFINLDQSQSFEFTPSGTLVFHEQSDNLTYRAFRVQDLYTPTL